MELNNESEELNKLQNRIVELEKRVNELRLSRRILMNLLDQEKRYNSNLIKMLKNLYTNRSI